MYGMRRDRDPSPYPSPLTTLMKIYIKQISSQGPLTIKWFLMVFAGMALKRLFLFKSQSMFILAIRSKRQQETVLMSKYSLD